MYHPHIRPVSTLPAFLLSLTASIPLGNPFGSNSFLGGAVDALSTHPIHVDHVATHDSHTVVAVSAAVDHGCAVPTAINNRRAMSRALHDGRAMLPVSINDGHIRVSAASHDDSVVPASPLFVDDDIVSVSMDVRVHIAVLVVVIVSMVTVPIEHHHAIPVSLIVIDDHHIVAVSSLSNHLDSVAVVMVVVSPASVSVMPIDDDHITIVSPFVQDFQHVSMSVSVVAEEAVPIMIDHHDLVVVPGEVPVGDRLDIEKRALVVVWPVAQVEVNQVSGVVVPPRTTLALPPPPFSLGMGMFRQGKGPLWHGVLLSGRDPRYALL